MSAPVQPEVVAVYAKKNYHIDIDGDDHEFGVMRFLLDGNYKPDWHIGLTCRISTLDPNNLHCVFEVVSSPPRDVPWDMEFDLALVVKDSGPIRQVLPKIHFSNYRLVPKACAILLGHALKIGGQGTIAPFMLVRPPVPVVPWLSLMDQHWAPKLELTVQGRVFSLFPKVLAAQSGYFNSMLRSNMTENQKMKCTYNDLNVHMFDKIVQYFYSGNPTNFDFQKHNIRTAEDVVELLVLADRLDISMLIYICERRLLEIINLKNYRLIMQTGLEMGTSNAFLQCVCRFMNIHNSELNSSAAAPSDKLFHLPLDMLPKEPGLEEASLLMSD